MPYIPPETSSTFSFPTIANNIVIVNDNEINDINDNNNIIIKENILSTSITRRKSNPESYSKKLSVDIVDILSQSKQDITCLIRKKSGEIVKSSLKKGLSKSEPVTPTFPKYVHFNVDLEQIKLFNGAQSPQAVNEDDYTDDTDDTDDDDNISEEEEEEEEEEEYDDDDYNSELYISLPNGPIITTLHNSKPVFVESIFLSNDKRKLQGRIMVQNIAFQKNVNIRYTFDLWSTVSEVSANYAKDISINKDDNKNNFDVFLFSIELTDNSRNSIDGKTMYFAVHYQVDDHDFWDNNDGSNYQVNFKKITPSSSSSTFTKKKNHNLNLHSRSTKTLNESLCHSPPMLSSSPNLISSITDLRKKLLGRYDIGVSLSAAQRSTTTSNITRTCQSFISNYNNESFQDLFPNNNFIDGMPTMTSTNPITIPLSKSIIESSSYHDFVNQYCFYSGSPIMTS